MGRLRLEELSDACEGTQPISGRAETSEPRCLCLRFLGSQSQGGSSGQGLCMLAAPTHPQGHVSLAQVDVSIESCLNVGLWASEFQLLWVLVPQHILGLPLLGCGKDWSTQLCPGTLSLGSPFINTLCPA